MYSILIYLTVNCASLSLIYCYRAEHEMREQQVREIHRDLQKGLEQWQDQVLLLQWADSQRAEACVQAQKENRRLKVEVENKERQYQHSERLKKLVCILIFFYIKNFFQLTSTRYINISINVNNSSKCL